MLVSLRCTPAGDLPPAPPRGGRALGAGDRRRRLGGIPEWEGVGTVGRGEDTDADRARRKEEEKKRS